MHHTPCEIIQLLPIDNVAIKEWLSSFRILQLWQTFFPSMFSITSLLPKTNKYCYLSLNLGLK